eukprot:3608780-Prymnesium_polylepis.1
MAWASRLLVSASFALTVASRMACSTRTLSNRARRVASKASSSTRLSMRWPQRGLCNSRQG